MGGHQLFGKSSADIMKPTSVLNGQHFGVGLAKVNGIVKYTLSPFEQRAFAGAVSFGIPNLFYRFRTQVLKVAPPFIIGYMIYDTIEAKHTAMTRKNPADFENDELNLKLI